MTLMHLCLLTHDTKTRTEYVQERKALVGNRVYLDNRFWEIERVDFPGVDSGLLKEGVRGMPLTPAHRGSRNRPAAAFDYNGALTPT